MNDEFVTQTELGVVFKVSNRTIGLWLIALELRTRDGRPTPKAIAGGYCSSRSTERGPSGESFSKMTFDW